MMRMLKSKKGFIVGTSVISGIFIFLIILLPIIAFGGGFALALLSNKYVLYLLGGVILIKLLFGGRGGG